MRSTDELLRDLTTEDLRSLPKEWVAVYLGRPSRKAIRAANSAMRIRAAVLLLIALYLYGESSLYGTPLALLLALACYEFAYFNLRKEKAELDYHLARTDYVAEVNSLKADDA